MGHFGKFPTGKMGGMEAGGRSQNGACLADIYGRLSCSLKKAVFAPATVPGLTVTGDQQSLMYRALCDAQNKYLKENPDVLDYVNSTFWLSMQPGGKKELRSVSGDVRRSVQYAVVLLSERRKRIVK